MQNSKELLLYFGKVTACSNLPEISAAHNIIGT